MRVVHAAALTAAAMLLASIGSAQGIGNAAARERQKRSSAPAKPAKVYTEGDLGASVAPPAPSSDQPAAGAGSEATPADGSATAPASGTPATGDATPPAATGAPPEGAAPGADAAAGAAADASRAEQEAAEQQAKAQKAWKKKLDQARQEEQVYKDVIDKLQVELNDTSGGFYNPGRASKMAFLEENKQKLTEVQARIVAIEGEGRRNGYR